MRFLWLCIASSSFSCLIACLRPQPNGNRSYGRTMETNQRRYSGIMLLYWALIAVKRSVDTFPSSTARIKGLPVETQIEMPLASDCLLNEVTKCLLHNLTPRIWGSTVQHAPQCTWVTSLGQRVGALNIVSSSPESVRAIMSQLNQVWRTSYFTTYSS